MPDLPDTIGRAQEAGYRIQMTCRSCGRVECADLDRLIAAGHGGMSLFELQPRLYCVRCGAFGAMQLALIKP